MKKKLDDLTLADIENSTWEVVIEDVLDEGNPDDLVEFALRSDLTVLPDQREHRRHQDYIVRCEFRLADGTVLDGYISPRHDIELISMFPTIFFNDQQLPLQSFGNVNHSKATLGLLGKRESEFFPVTIKSMVAYDGKFLELRFEEFP